MTPPGRVEAIQVAATELLARIDAGAPPATGTGRGAQIMSVLRAIVERIMRRQIAHQEQIQRQTLHLIQELSVVLGDELAALETAQREQGREAEELADRARLSASLVDELIAALSPTPVSGERSSAAPS